MSDVSITYAGIFHVKDDLWRFINTMEDHQKVLVFTINGENNITKGLYADVSEKCSSTPVRVERNIRHAIEIGFLKGNLEMIKKIFTSSNYSDKGAPTNSNFLAAIYYYMVNNEL